VSGGACIVIQAGKIDIIAPGTITVKAAMKDLIAVATLNPAMPEFPKDTARFPLLLEFDHAPAGIKSAWAGMPYKLYADGALVQEGVVETDGYVKVMHSPLIQTYRLEMANGVKYEMPIVDQYRNPTQGEAANRGYLKHRPGPPAADTGQDAPPASLRETYRKSFRD